MSKLALFIVDSPRRDLKWRLLLAKKLSDRGVGCFIGSAHKVRIKFAQCGGVLIGRLGGTSGRSKFDRLFTREIETLAGRIFYFHDEGGAFKVNDYERETRLAYPAALFDSNIIEKVYFWGEAQKNIFLNESWIGKSGILGSPRFDIYNGPVTGVNGEERYILINSRFSNVNTVADDPSALSKRMYEIRCEGGELSYRTEKEIKLQMYRRWQVSARDYVEFVSMVAQVALEFPDQRFKFRPHPAEDDGWYRNNFANIENIEVDKEGDVNNVMRGADLVIHSECTTGLEAELMGKPHINFIPFPEEEGEGVVGLRSIGKIVHDARGVIDAVKLFHSGGLVYTKDYSSIGHYISNIGDLGSATTALAEDVATYYGATKTGKSKSLPITEVLYLQARNFLRGIYKSLNSKAGSSTKFVWPNSEELKNMWSEFGGETELIGIHRNAVSIRPREN